MRSIYLINEFYSGANGLHQPLGILSKKYELHYSFSILILDIEKFI